MKLTLQPCFFQGVSNESLDNLSANQLELAMERSWRQVLAMGLTDPAVIATTSPVKPTTSPVNITTSPVNATRDESVQQLPSGINPNCVYHGSINLKPDGRRAKIIRKCCTKCLSCKASKCRQCKFCLNPYLKKTCVDKKCLFPIVKYPCLCNIINC